MTKILHYLCALIVDDEPHNRDTLGKLIKRYCPGLMVAGKADGVGTGIKAIRVLKPDIVFLDVNMSDGTAFDLLHALVPVDFRVILVSALDKDTIRAFRLSGMEYLLKPVSPEELKMAVERVIKAEVKHFALQLEALEGNIRLVRRLDNWTVKLFCLFNLTAFAEPVSA